MTLLRTAVLVMLTLVMGGCATPMRVSLTPEQRAKITELKAHVVVVQDEVIVAVQPSNVGVATGGGLIGAMIDSSVTNSRVKDSQEVMGPLYAQIEDVDYRKEFNEAIRRELEKYPIKVAQFTTTPRALGRQTLAQLRSTLEPGQALLVIYPRYFLTMDFRNLDTEAVVSMWMKDGPDNVPIQRGVLHYQSQPVGPGGKESIALWGRQDAAEFRAAIKESIVETIELVSMDINLAAPGDKQEKSREYTFNAGGQQAQIKGRLIKEGVNRWIVLGDDKKLYSLPTTSKAVAAANR
ncbi:hypothetical protein [Variovorax sp. YR216]|uniref:hypothetical protein n=1 Tax=Variovorax sp. YR216 TaxID=1882828 RepID=UPI0008994430|nr:hypothetical protein [Variovorax sp. YR216]SEA53807.1 hypothetical protein SAMN05444680_102817 [Variovorax sp. YR216]